MGLGIILGVLGSLLYWHFAKTQERIAKERRERGDNENPNGYIQGKLPGQPTTLFDSDEERDDLKRYKP